MFAVNQLLLKLTYKHNKFTWCVKVPYYQRGKKMGRAARENDNKELQPVFVLTYSNACKWTPAVHILCILVWTLHNKSSETCACFLALQVYPAMDVDSANSVVLQALTQATSQDTAVLKPAEEQLRQWETQPGFYSVLLVRDRVQHLTDNIAPLCSSLKYEIM